MAATQYDIEIEQGSTFEWEIQVLDTDGTTPLSLAGFLIRSMIRKKYEDAAATETFTVTITNESNGIFVLSLSATETAAIAKGRYVYDVELEDINGKVVKLYRGNVTVIPEATK